MKIRLITITLILKYKYFIVLIAVVVFLSGYFSYYGSQIKNEMFLYFNSVKEEQISPRPKSQNSEDVVTEDILPWLNTATSTKSEQYYNKYSGWNIFSDEDGILEFRYPPEWEVKSGPGHLILRNTESFPNEIMIYISNDNRYRLPIEYYLKLNNAVHPYESYGIIDNVEALKSGANPISINFTKGIYVFRIVPLEGVNEKEVRDILDTFIVHPSDNTMPNSPIVQIKAQLSEPYFAWEGGQELGETQFFLIGASLGETPAPAGLLKFPEEGTYQKGEKVYALTLTLRIYKLKTGRVPLSLRHIVDESGTSVPPNTPEFVFSGSGDNQAIQNSTHIHDVIFVVPKQEKEFMFETGGHSDTSFILRQEGNTLILDVLVMQG